MEKIRDLTCLSDILPTGFHGAITAKVGVGSTVYVAGAGPVGLAAAASARILGAAVVLIGDMNRERLAHAKKVGFEPIDLTRHDRLGELVADVVGVPEVDCAIDCVGFEAKAQSADGRIVEAPAVVLNSLMEITRAAGAIGIPGLYVTDDPGAKEQAAKHGNLSLRLGISIGASSAVGVDVKADAGVALSAGPAAAAGDVEGDRYEVADVEVLDVTALFDHFAGDLVSERHAGRRCRAASDHVLVGATDIRRYDFENNAVIDSLSCWIPEARKIDLLNFDPAGFEVNHAAIGIGNHP
jgi:Alanine dehydrogenase/PNT, C-terminal domain